MPRKVVFVHGIGDHQAGYSDSWRDSLNQHLDLPLDAYLESLWEPVLDAPARTVAALDSNSSATSDGDRAASELRNEILEMINAQANAAEALIRPDAMVVPTATEVSTRGFLDWFRRPDEYIGDFVRYFVDDSVRSQVKDAVLQTLLNGTQPGDEVSIVSHSWGTVVSYDLLHDLAEEHPDRRIHTFFTLGSPLWMWPVRRRLRSSSGEKPSSVDFWVNVDARGDLIGGWLHPEYAVDRDYGVPTPEGHSPHGSYFAAENDEVLRDLIAYFISI